MRADVPQAHVDYSLAEFARVSRSRTVQQRRVLHLGELNSTQVEQWQRTNVVIEESGEARPRRLFTDRKGLAPAPEDAVLVGYVMFVRLPTRS